MMMTTLLYGRGKRRFAAQLQHFPKLKSGGSGLFPAIEANALFVKRQSAEIYVVIIIRSALAVGGEAKKWLQPNQSRSTVRKRPAQF